jgi:hypothetical protein
MEKDHMYEEYDGTVMMKMPIPGNLFKILKMWEIPHILSKIFYLTKIYSETIQAIKACDA